MRTTATYSADVTTREEFEFTLDMLLAAAARLTAGVGYGLGGNLRLSCEVARLPSGAASDRYPTDDSRALTTHRRGLLPPPSPHPHKGMKYYDSYTVSPRHPDRIREALRARVLEPFNDPAEQLEAISVGPRSLWYHYADENDLRDMQGGAVASHIVDVAEILRDLASECAPDAIDSAPNLEELSIRLSRAGGLAREIENTLSRRGYGAYSNTCSLKDIGIDTSRLPTWGEGPTGIPFPKVFSWDAESMIAHGRADGDRIFRIYPRNAEWMERLGGRSSINIFELPSYLGCVRQWRGLSQAVAGTQIGVSGSYVGQIERAERWPSVYALEKLATWLDARVHVSPVEIAEADRPGPRGRTPRYP